MCVEDITKHHVLTREQFVNGPSTIRAVRDDYMHESVSLFPPVADG